MTSFGKHAYLHVYSNSHTTYQINPFFLWSTRALSQQPGAVFSGDLQHCGAREVLKVWRSP